MNAQTSPIKFTRFNPSARGSRAKVVCWDCNEFTGAPLQVYRMSDRSPLAARYDEAIVVYVHRAGAGCHKAHDASAIRDDKGVR